ncbi:MAG: methyltransferase domain-containing protein [Verrucomicrobia bacterium]|nr:methyltransferase domain-containing protein [Verrucomicrobiota bacterium]
MENPNVARFTGFADIYEKYRPIPPAIIADLLLQLAGMDRADHVVDLGCGTGLSMLIWLNNTGRLTGVEPSPDMCAVAKERVGCSSTTTQVEFIAGGTPDSISGRKRRHNHRLAILSLDGTRIDPPRGCSHPSRGRRVCRL